MSASSDDWRFMGAALALASRGIGTTFPNPSVGCVIAKDGRVAGRGWTQPGGRPHAEAVALSQAGQAARGATAFVTLEPCAHVSPRGPSCAESLIAAGVARVVIAAHDPDPRTDGDGVARLRAAGIAVTTGVRDAEAEQQLAGFLTRLKQGRPHITLKLAVSLDGAIAMADGRSQWITGERARAAAHLERARADLIVVGRGTWDADQPRLDVRLPGLETRTPRMGIVGRGDGLPDHVTHFPDLAAADLVDTLMLMRAPILIGAGRTLGDIGLADLPHAHGRWVAGPAMMVGPDRIERYARTR